MWRPYSINVILTSVWREGCPEDMKSSILSQKYVILLCYLKSIFLQLRFPLFSSLFCQPWKINCPGSESWKSISWHRSRQFASVLRLERSLFHSRFSDNWPQVYLSICSCYKGGLGEIHADTCFDNRSTPFQSYLVSLGIGFCVLTVS